MSAKLDGVEQLLPHAAWAGLRLTHMAMVFVMTRPGVTSTIIGPRQMEHLDNLLAGADLILDDQVRDQIDAIVPLGTDGGPLDAAYNPAAITQAHLRRRPTAERAAA